MCVYAAHGTSRCWHKKAGSSYRLINGLIFRLDYDCWREQQHHNVSHTRAHFTSSSSSFFILKNRRMKERNDHKSSGIRERLESMHLKNNENQSKNRLMFRFDALRNFQNVVEIFSFLLNDWSINYLPIYFMSVKESSLLITIRWERKKAVSTSQL